MSAGVRDEVAEQLAGGGVDGADVEAADEPADVTFGAVVVQHSVVPRRNGAGSRAWPSARTQLAASRTMAGELVHR